MRKMRLLSGLAVLTGLVWAQSAAAIDADEAYQSASRAISQQQRSVGAIRGAMASANSGERSAAQRLADGELLVRSKDYERAAIVYNEIVEKYPNRPEVYAEALYGLGETYYLSRQYLSARRVFMRIVQDANSPRLVAYRGRSLARLIDVALRIRDLASLDDIFTRINQLPTASVEAILLYSRGRALLAKQDLPSARRALMSVPADSPYYHQAKYLLGVVALREVRGAEGVASPAEAPGGTDMRGKYAPAIEAFRQVTQLPADSPEHRHVIDLSWLAIGRLLFDSEQLGPAAEAYNHVYRDSPEFGRMLYELASVYVQMGDSTRAQRALEVLSVADPDGSDAASGSLLRGDLLLRSGQFRPARETFEAVRGQFDPMRAKVDGFLGATRDPAAYYEKLVQEQLDVLDDSSPLPQLAVRWAREAEDGPEAFAVVDEVVQTRKLLKRSQQLVERLTAVMTSPGAIRAFPALLAGEQAAVAVINGTARARFTLAQGLDSTEEANVGQEFGAVRAERRAIEQRIQQLPVTATDFQQRDDASFRQWNQASQKLQQLELQVDTLQAVVNALHRVLRESATRGVVLDLASSRRLDEELKANEQDIAVYRRRIGELRRSVENGKITSGFGDTRFREDEATRARYKIVLLREVQLAARGEAGQRAAAFASRLLPLLASADRVDEQVEAIRSDIARQSQEKSRSVMTSIRSEQDKIGEYVGRLDLLDQEARLVVGQVALRNFGLVRDRLKGIVLRADVGITEEAWEAREEQQSRVRNLQSERARTERVLNEELREVLDDAADE